MKQIEQLQCSLCTIDYKLAHYKEDGVFYKQWKFIFILDSDKFFMLHYEHILFNCLIESSLHNKLIKTL